ncbi:MAG TPA: MFS transporter [Acidimicrobiales bacterium]|nr:MFS transporter [Acidimicrobiales bacterium]
MGVEAEPDVAPPRGVRGALAETWASLRSVFVNPALRRIELALGASMIGDWAFATAVTVYAYNAGGAKLVGVWFAVRLILMAIVAPLASSLADRLPRKMVLITSDIARAVLIALAAVLVVIDAPTLSVIVISTLTGLIGCIFRPTQMAWMPSLTTKPEELTAANGASSTIESLAFFVGPAIGATLVATTSIETVFVLNAVTFLVSAVLVSGITPVVRDTPPAETDAGDDAPAEPGGALREMAGGFREIAHNRDLFLVGSLLCAQTIVAGATIVLGVTWAVEILERGPEAVGIIDSAFGVGAIVGGFYAIARASKNRLAADMAFGTALWSLPLLIIVVWPSPVTVFAAVVLMGFGNPLVDVNFATITQRIVPDAVLGRVFGAFEGAFISTMALGSLVTPFLLEQLGMRWTLTILAVVVGAPALIFLPRCLRLDEILRPPEGTDLLRRIPIFAPMPQSAIEALARRLVHESTPAGSPILSEGESSDRFLVIQSGRVEVTQDGRHIRFEGPGEFFGEIGLLRDVPRTATVSAVEDTELLSLAREPFLEAVRGTDEALTAADDIVTRRLG